MQPATLGQEGQYIYDNRALWVVKVNPQESYMLLYVIQRQLCHPETQHHRLTFVFWLIKGKHSTAPKFKSAATEPG